MAKMTDDRDLEKQAADKAKSRYRATVSHYRDNEEETETAVGRLALSNLTPFVEQELSQWKAQAVGKTGRHHAALPLLNVLDETKAAMLISRAVLNTISNAKSMTALHLSIGAAFETEHRLEQLYEQDSKLFDQVRDSIWRSRGSDRQHTYFFETYKKISDVTASRWTADEKLRVGAVGLEIFIRATGVVEVQTYYDATRNRNKSVVIPTEAMQEWLDKAHEFREELRPFHLPMLDKPVAWTRPDLGGYVERPLTLVKSHADFSDITVDAAPKVYEAINRVQDTGWQVNRRVLEVVEHLRDNDIEVPGLPSKHRIPWPTKPTDIDSNDEARKAYGAEKARIRAANNQQKSKKLSVASILQTARQFRNEDEFFFPQQYDFRGRMYSVPVGLNNQGSDLARSLLQFSVGKPMTEHEQFQHYKIKGANHYGLSNLSFLQRVKWVEDLRTQILDAGLDPLNHMSFWAEAKEPFQFLAWIIEYSGIMNDCYTPSYLPCSIDGTNNGCQIWSLIRRDPKTGRATNCTYTATPQDLYEEIAKATLDSLDEGFYAQEWRRIGIDRSTVKGPVMIVPYAATLQGVSNAIYRWLEKKRNDGLEPRWKSDFLGANYLAQQIWKILPSYIPAVLEGKDYLQRLSMATTAAGAPIAWRLPTGFRVTNAYYRKRTRKVRTKLGTRYHVSYLQEPQKKLCKRRQNQTITANFTHSYDAALMVETICSAPGITHWSTVHDSYGCHAADVTELARTVRATAARLFEGDVLRDLHDQVAADLTGVTLPVPPKLGGLDPEAVKESLYFFN